MPHKFATKKWCRDQDYDFGTAVTASRRGTEEFNHRRPKLTLRGKGVKIGDA